MPRTRSEGRHRDEFGRWIGEIQERVDRSTSPDRPKHERLTEALRAMIRDRRIAPNDRLPPERVLAAGLNVSLGTIQKALEALVLDGFVVRELGRGSFVSEYRESFSGPWHHRFVRPGDSTVLPVRTSLVYRRIVRRRGPWSDALGSDPGGYVCIARRVSAGDEVMCFTRTWLPAEHCLGLLDIPAGEIVGENLRMTLGTRFNLPVSNAVQYVRADRLDTADCRHLDLPTGTIGMIMEVVGYTAGERPVFFANIATRPSGLRMVQMLPRGYWA